MKRYVFKGKGIEDLVSVNDSLAVLQDNGEKRGKGNRDERKAADKFLREAAVDHYKSTLGDQYTGTVETISGKDVKEGLEMMRDGLNHQRTDLFSYNLDAILSDGKKGIGRDALDILISQEDVRKNVENGDDGILGLYSGMADLRNLKDRYEKAGEQVLDEKEKKLVSKYAGEGAAEATRKRFKDANYDEDMQDLAARTAMIAVASGDYDEDSIDKFVITGIDSQVEEIEKVYAEVSKDRSIYDVARDAVKNIEKQDRDKAMNLVIGSYKTSQASKDAYQGRSVIGRIGQSKVAKAA